MKKNINILLRETFFFYVKTLEISQNMSCQNLQNYRYILANFIINVQYRVSRQWNVRHGVTSDNSKHIILKSPR